MRHINISVTASAPVHTYMFAFVSPSTWNALADNLKQIVSFLRLLNATSYNILSSLPAGIRNVSRFFLQKRLGLCKFVVTVIITVTSYDGQIRILPSAILSV